MHHIYLFEQNFLIVNMFKLCTLNLFRYYWSVSQTHWDRPVLRYILKTRLKMVTWQTFRESDVKTLLFIVLGPDLSQCSALWWADDSWGSPKLHSRRSELRSRVGLQSGGQKNTAFLCDAAERQRGNIELVYFWCSSLSAAFFGTWQSQVHISKSLRSLKHPWGRPHRFSLKGQARTWWMNHKGGCGRSACRSSKAQEAAAMFSVFNLAT